MRKHYVNEEYGVYIIQQDDGNLVVHRGTPDNPGEAEVWSHGEMGGSLSYFMKLNGDSNLMTMAGSLENEGDQLWKSNTINPEGDYFLGIDCNSEVISTAVAMI